MLKNLSFVSSRTSPVSTSTSDNPKSFEYVRDSPTANAIELPSGENSLSPIRIGSGRDEDETQRRYQALWRDALSAAVGCTFR